MAFKKYQIKYFIIILLATLAINMPTMHSICHFSIFRNWVDSKDHFKNDYEKERTHLGAKSKLGPNRETAQNVRTKSAFMPL